MAGARWAAVWQGLALALLVVAFAVALPVQPARAVDECGGIPILGTVDCDAAENGAAANGFSYTPAADMVLNLNNGFSISVTGADGGEVTHSAGSLTLNSANGSSVDSQTHFGLALQTSSGNMTIDIDGQVSSAATTALSAVANTAGNIEITGAGSVTGGAGILAAGIATVADDGDVTIDFDGPITGGSGILARTNDANTLTITTDGVVEGTAGWGILAEAIQGTEQIIVTANNTVTGAVDGIEAVTTVGSGSTSVQGTGAITGTTGIGIQAVGASGAVTVDVDGAVMGGTYGIWATTGGAGVLEVTTDGAVTGTTEDGIFTVADDGATTITTNDTVTGGDDGITSFADGTGAISITSNAAVTGQAGSGISATTASGNIAVDANATVEGVVYGIWANADGAGTVLVETDQLVSGSNGTGIAGIAEQGTVTIVIDNDVTGRQNGIYGQTDSADISITGIGNVTANGPTLFPPVPSVGIEAMSDFAQTAAGGAILIDVDGNIAGDDRGISARTTGAGTVTVVGSDNALITGTNEIGIETIAQNGNTSISNATNGVVTGGVSGIDASATGSGNILISNGPGASVTGGTQAILAQASGGTITILGDILTTIANTDGLFGSMAIDATGGATAITSNGAVTGRLRLSALDDVFDNNWTWNVNGSNDFGLGTDIVNNRITNAAGSAGLATTTTLMGLETFNNAAGRFNLSDQATGDGSNIADVASISGAFVGGGTSVLAIDAFLGGPGSTADMLLAGTTSGATGIEVVDTNPGPGALNTAGIVVVDAGASSETDFFIASFASTNGTTRMQNGKLVLDKGLIYYELVYDPATAQHLLVGLCDAECVAAPGLTTAMQNIWHDTAGVWLDRVADLRTAAGRGEGEQPFAVWAKGQGSWTDVDLDVGGMATGYSQFTLSGQGGFDGQVRLDEATILFGVGGGAINSGISFREGATTADALGATASAYATYLNGGLFVDALAKLDVLDLDVSVAGSTGSAGVLNLGLRVDAGYRVDLAPGVFVEPQGTIAYVHTRIGDMTLGGIPVAFGDGHGLRASGGVRAGTELELGDQRLEASAMARLWAELGEPATASIGGTTVTLADGYRAPYADLSGILNLFDGAGNSAFAKGGAMFNDEMLNLNLQMGLRRQLQ